MDAVPSRVLMRSVEDLSRRYREGHARGESVFLRSPDDVLAYAACRVPATYAAIQAALVAVRDRQPSWKPRTLLDVGAGPGSAAWAATQVWPELEQITLLERDDRMISLGRRLASRADSRALREADWRPMNVVSGWALPSHDLVIAAYLLGELGQGDRDELVDRLWSGCADTLLLLEPGTPRGYAVVLQGRDRLLASGAFMTAPCPHDRSCPLAAGDWCHFAQRVTRGQVHRAAKGATLPYEDEKFSYAALSRSPSLPIDARVIRHPQIRPGHIYLDLCGPQGIDRRVVTRRDKEAFRRARRLRWGAALEPCDRCAGLVERG